jgi:hypothetical protein
MKDTKDLLDEVVHSYTNLNVFAIVKAVLESSARHGASEQSAAVHIGKLCDAAMQRQLRVHDKANAELMKAVSE